MGAYRDNLVHAAIFPMPHYHFRELICLQVGMNSEWDAFVQTFRLPHQRPPRYSRLPRPATWNACSNKWRRLGGQRLQQCASDMAGALRKQRSRVILILVNVVRTPTYYRHAYHAFNGAVHAAHAGARTFSRAGQCADRSVDIRAQQDDECSGEESWYKCWWYTSRTA
jgi:hypothetical protein